MHRLAAGGALVALACAAAGAGTPGESALAALRQGNARFAGGASEAATRRSPRGAAVKPGVAVLSCADARVPPDVVFDAGLGELYVVRAAGHVTDRSVVASLEYAAEQLQVPLLLVMGHESCDLVAAAMNGAPRGGGHLDHLFQAIRPSVQRAAAEPASTRLRAAILMHVEGTINELLETSGVIRTRAESGALTLAGAYYEMTTGRAHFSEPVHVPPRVAADRAPAAAGQRAAPAAAGQRAAPAAAAAKPTTAAP